MKTCVHKPRLQVIPGEKLINSTATTQRHEITPQRPFAESAIPAERSSVVAEMDVIDILYLVRLAGRRSADGVAVSQVWKIDSADSTQDIPLTDSRIDLQQTKLAGPGVTLEIQVGKAGKPNLLKYRYAQGNQRLDACTHDVTSAASMRRPHANLPAVKHARTLQSESTYACRSKCSSSPPGMYSWVRNARPLWNSS
jgi:hypothetical protein